jgi:deoxyhypusine synthase
MGKYLDKPTKRVDVSSEMSLDALVTSFSGASFQARNLYRCVEVYRRMLQDKQAVIFLGLAGAMVPAGMRKIISDLTAYRLSDWLIILRRVSVRR